MASSGLLGKDPNESLSARPLPPPSLRSSIELNRLEGSPSRRLKPKNDPAMLFVSLHTHAATRDEEEELLDAFKKIKANSVLVTSKAKDWELSFLPNPYP